MKTEKRLLNQLGIYGFDHLEPVILASLVSQDPLLLIGMSGTGKTLLLNRLAEVLNLSHRHYNASYISFDDLMGYPIPSEDKVRVEFLQTPATIWGAQSVIVDEISRCKPEIQNKFFSLIHEKKIQGLPLESLCYRWAAMNPVASYQTQQEEIYEGSVSLDAALADRFAFIVMVPDWGDFSQQEQESILLSGGKCSFDPLASIDFQQHIEELKEIFHQRLAHPPYEIIVYCRMAVSLLNEAGFRLSPRRAAMMVRNLVALNTLDDSLFSYNHKRAALYKLGLQWSLPQRALGVKIENTTIDAVHAESIKSALESDPSKLWLTEFHLCRSLSGKIRMLLTGPVDREIKSIALIQFLGKEQPGKKAIFSFALHPLACEKDFLTEEAVIALGETAVQVYTFSGELQWRDNNYGRESKHPLWSECVQYLNQLPGKESRRKQRATQLFLYHICNDIPFDGPRAIEEELNECFVYINKYLAGEGKRIFAH